MLRGGRMPIRSVTHSRFVGYSQGGGLRAQSPWLNFNRPELAKLSTTWSLGHQDLVATLSPLSRIAESRLSRHFAGKIYRVAHVLRLRLVHLRCRQHNAYYRFWFGYSEQESGIAYCVGARQFVTGSG